MKNFVLKGHVCYNKNKNELITQENAYVVCVDGKSEGVFSELPPQYATLPLIYPYFFVNLETQGVAGVAKWAVILFVAFMAVGFVFYGIDKLFKGKTKAEIHSTDIINT